MDEEEYLVKQLEAIRDAHIKAAEPFVQRLVALRSLRPPEPMIIAKDDLHKFDLTGVKTR